MARIVIQAFSITFDSATLGYHFLHSSSLVLSENPNSPENDLSGQCQLREKMKYSKINKQTNKQTSKRALSLLHEIVPINTKEWK